MNTPGTTLPGGGAGQWGAGETLALTLQRREEDRL